MYRLWFTFIITLFSCFHSMTATTHDKPFFFQHLTMEDGLSNNHVSAIFQSKDGILWLGTQKGLMTVIISGSIKKEIHPPPTVLEEMALKRFFKTATIISGYNTKKERTKSITLPEMSDMDGRTTLSENQLSISALTIINNCSSSAIRKYGNT
jgi:hypothetical protein